MKEKEAKSEATPVAEVVIPKGPDATPPPAKPPENPPAPIAEPEPPATPAPAAPPAATAVIEGKTEREIALEKKLKQAETDAAHHQDEARKLKQLQSGGTPAKKKKKSIRWTLLHPSDESD